MKPFHYVTMLLLAFFLFSGCNDQPARQYGSHNLEDGILEIAVSDGHYRIRALNANIIETSFIPAGETYDPVSHAVVMEPRAANMELTETSDSLRWSGAGIAVHISKSPFGIRYTYRGRELIAESAGYTTDDTSQQLGFRLDPTEALYGGGARALGMNRRGHRLRLYNKAHYGYEEHSELMNFTMPLVLSSKQYLIHFDNAPIGLLDLDSRADNTLTYSTVSGRKTYQVVAGDSWPELMEQYTLLTGRQPLPPRWAFGNFASRFGYHSEQEVRETVARFIHDSIPLDAVVIDIYWFGADIKGHMGNLEFLADSFPTPQDMMADLEEKGVKTVLVTEPFILTTSKRWEEAVEQGVLALDSAGQPYTYDFYFGNTGLIDLYNPKAAQWFWDIYKFYTEMGVSGWWGDLGEPEVHPSGLIHAAGTADEVHNIYGHDWARLIFEGYRRDFPDRRPFILMRAGYSGSQRFGMIPWSGDVSRSWGGLVSQTEIALQMGMQGLAYMHSDLGGFGGGIEFDPRLYTRWLQFGVFQPLFRPHAQEHIPAEPVFHDEKTKALARQAIELRYRMLPYNYTLAFENSRSGIPMMRPLMFEEPANAVTHTLSDSYLWGDAFLVTPVTDSLQDEQEIYLPSTASWIDFYSGERYAGGQTVTLPLAEDHIPVFVRGGSFVPLVDVFPSTSAYSTQQLSLHYYFDPACATSTYRMYDDDGETPQAHDKGRYEMLECASTWSTNRLTLQLQSAPGENYRGPDRNIRLQVHLDRSPKKLAIDGKPASYRWNAEELVMHLSIELKNKEGIEIQIDL